MVYANTPGGAVLVAAMYTMGIDQVDAVPPMPGGCLTQWHCHTNLCFSQAAARWSEQRAKVRALPDRSTGSPSP